MRAAMVAAAGLALGCSALVARNPAAGAPMKEPTATGSGAGRMDGLGTIGIAYHARDIHQWIDRLIPDAKAKGSGGVTLENSPAYKVQISVRTVSGGAEIHAHWDDVMLVEQGTAKLVTGGTVVGGKTDADGETRGENVSQGHAETIEKGDVITVRAGTPHQLLLDPGTIYAAVVIKVHEP